MILLQYYRYNFLIHMAICLHCHNTQHTSSFPFQRMVVQLEQMAARPFSSCGIDVTPLNNAVSTKKEPPDPRGSRRKKMHSNKVSAPTTIKNSFRFEVLKIEFKRSIDFTQISFLLKVRDDAIFQNLINVFT